MLYTVIIKYEANHKLNVFLAQHYELITKRFNSAYCGQGQPFAFCLKKNMLYNVFIKYEANQKLSVPLT